jgi:general transcription factor 3C polypeptide 2
MGASLIGRGAVQIWCLLNIREPNEEVSSFTVKKEKKPKKDMGTNDKSTEIKRPRGRPRKNPTGIVVDDAQSLTAQENPENNEEIVPITNKRKRGRPKKNPTENNEEIVPVTNKRRGRPKKNLTLIAVDDTNCETVQCEQNSTEFPATNGNNENNEGIFRITYKRKKVPRGNEAMNEKPALIKRPIRRPKKNSKEVTANDPNCEKQYVPLAVQLPDSVEFISPDIVHGNSNEHHSQQLSTTKGKESKKAASACNSETLVTESRLDINHRERSYSQDTSRPLLIQCENEANHQPNGSSVLEPQASTCPIPQNVALPRVVSCLAHNGKVAWDVKWRPLNNLDSSCKHRMGYLAVLLGNGSLEV